MVELAGKERAMIAGRAFPVVAGIALLLAGCADEKPRASLARLPFGSMDTPRNGDTIRGPTLIGGWALAESGIDSVTIYVDRNLAAFASLGINRPDVQKAF